MTGTRPIRFIGAAAALGAAAWVWSPHVTGHVTRTAVVNAPMTTLTSPFDGRVLRASPAEGDAVSPDVPVLRIVRRGRERAPAAELAAERDTLGRQAEVLQRRLETLDSRISELAQHTREHTTASTARLRAELRAARAAAERADAKLRHAQSDRQRVTKLADNGYRSGAQRDAARAAVATARAERAEAEARAEAAQTALEAVRTGTFVGRGFEDVPYSRRRLDQLRVRRHELAAEIDRLEAERRALAQRVTRVRARVETARSFAPSGTGVVWRDSPAAGSPVAEGEPVARLIACSQRFIEAHVDPDVAGSVAVGDRAQFRLAGTNRWYSGEIRAIRGAGSRHARDRLAAQAPEPDPDAARVIVAPPVSGFAMQGAPFCHVGRMAEVRLDRRNPLQSVRTAALRAAEDAADVFDRGAAEPAAGATVNIPEQTADVTGDSAP